MDPATRHKAAFITQSGIYEWMRLPFGLSNSPASFSMVMAQVLRGVNWKFVLCYDDILVFSENVQKHLDHLKQVFQRLQKANLALKPSRTCDNKGRSQSRSYKNISGYSTFPVPKTRNEVRSFLGMCNYYRKFLKNYSKITTPLTTLLEKDELFKWTAKCQQAFEELKTKLTTSPIEYSSLCRREQTAYNHM